MGSRQGALPSVPARALPNAMLKRSRLINLFTSAVFVKDRQHRCVMLNDECCRLLGHARQILIGKTDYDYLPKDTADRIWEREEQVFLTGHGVYDEETLADRKGATRTYSTTKTLFTDPTGGAWLFGVMDDITVHTRTLDDCRYMASLLEAQNEAAIDGILVVDESANIVTTNRRFSEMWGIPPEIMALKSDAKARESVLHKLVDPAVFQKRVDYLYRHRDQKARDEIALRDGRLFDRYTAPVVGEHGFYYGRVWHFRDVTDSRRCADLKAEVKQRRALDALKDQFIGTVSHELRTPLTVVRTAVDSLRDGAAGPLTPKQKEVADLCHRNVLRLCKMIMNLLDISRLESGFAKARFQSLDLKPLLADHEANFRMMELGKSIAIKIDAPADLPLVRGDSELISEVLYNLLDNAARFARRQVRVKVTRESADASGRETKGVRVAVIDDGPGIPPGQIGQLFNKFTQVERAVGGGYKGTGLGLAICKEIMKLHGSSIAVENAPGGGARFHFFLPEWTVSPARAVRAASVRPAAGRGRA